MIGSGITYSKIGLKAGTWANGDFSKINNIVGLLGLVEC